MIEMKLMVIITAITIKARITITMAKITIMARITLIMVGIEDHHGLARTEWSYCVKQ